MFFLVDPASTSKLGTQGISNVAPLGSSLKCELCNFYFFHVFY
jgi:hypothetical protein